MKKLIFLSTLLCIGCAQNSNFANSDRNIASIQEFDTSSANPSTKRLSIITVDKDIPKEYQEKLKDVYVRIIKNVNTSMIVPRDLEIFLSNLDDNPMYMPDDTEQRIFFPYILKIGKVELARGDALLPAFAHEFGHYIFNINFLKALNASKYKNNARLQEYSAFRRHMHYKRMIERWRNGRVNKENKDIKIKIASTRKKDEILTSKFNMDEITKNDEQIYFLSFVCDSYDEMFADLIAALVFKDPKAATEIMVAIDKDQAVARSFTNDIDYNKWKNTDVHQVIVPARAAAWKLASDNNMTASSFLKSMFITIVNELDRMAKVNPEKFKNIEFDETVQSLNESFIKEFKGVVNKQ